MTEDVRDKVCVVKTGTVKISGTVGGEEKSALLSEGDEFKPSEFGLDEEQAKQLLAAGTVEPKGRETRKVEAKDDDSKDDDTKTPESTKSGTSTQPKTSTKK
jgi:hypothetical protein